VYRTTLRITLENVASLPIDFLKITFDDSTIGPAQQALADGELSVFETYETEYSLIHRPTFVWEEKKAAMNLPPGQKTTVTVICFGKVGWYGFLFALTLHALIILSGLDSTSGTIRISYAYVHRHQNSLQQPPDVFQTRQLSYPVLVTVYDMLECHGMDILPYIHHRSGEGGKHAKDRSTDALLDVPDEMGWCMFAVDVRNTYGIPFEVSFERIQDGGLMSW
jgi:trafficking protein particle complex subunit 9